MKNDKTKNKRSANNDANTSKGTLGTFAGVFTPSILTILGIILFLRLGFVVGNAGDATTEGVEVSMRWQATDYFMLRSSASYNEGEYSSSYITQCYTLQSASEGCDPVTNTQDLDGKSLPRAPKYTFGVGGLFTIPVGFGNLSLAADANWSDEYQIETTNNPYLEQESFWRIDASVALESCDGKWRAMLMGRNLTDETITSFGATRGFTNDQLAELMPLRQVSAEVSYKF